MGQRAGGVGQDSTQEDLIVLLNQEPSQQEHQGKAQAGMREQTFSSALGPYRAVLPLKKHQLSEEPLGLLNTSWCSAYYIPMEHLTPHGCLIGWTAT